MSDEEQPIVWASTLDDRYRCVVTRTGNWTGHYTVTDTETDEELLSEEVELSYGAKLGPDVADIRQWQDMAIEVVGDERS